MAGPAERCSVRSEAAGEPLLATASTIRRWMLLEHPGPWGERSLLDARLPAGLGRALRGLERDLGIRVLLIRRPGGATGGTRACFAIRSGPNDPLVERTDLDRIEDVLDLDLDSLMRGDPLGLQPHTAPVLVVCTHGRHDPCCAERGRPLARALHRTHPDETWESTHVGGDRFAANVVAFPHGWYFGRVEPEAGPALALAYSRGRLDLARARGRSCFPLDVQAVDLFLRTELGLDGIDDVSPRRLSRRGAVSVVEATTRAGAFEVRVRRSTEPPTALTCRAREEGAAPAFELVGIAPVA